MPNAVTFFFPYREVSGVPVLFARMARELAARSTMHVRVIDFVDGYQSRVLSGASNVEVVPFEEGKAIEIAPHDCLVMQAILPSTIPSELRPASRTRLFFWTLHPMNLVQTIVPTSWGRDFQARRLGWNRRFLSVAMRGHREMMRGLITSMHRRGALAFMDGTTLQSTTLRLGIEINDPRLLAVPVDMNAGRARQGPRGSLETLDVAWLGRLSNDKAYILSYTATRMSAWAAAMRRRVTFHVIGDGPFASYVRKHTTEHAYFRFEFAGVRMGAELRQYLDSRIDLLAAMGTSALEGAALGIPTILLDISYGAIRGDYLFRWLFESRQLSLADLVGPESFSLGNRSLETMLAALEHDYTALSDRTYAYCREHHALPAVADQLVDAINCSTFTWADINPRMLRKSLIRQVYGWWRSQHRSQWGRCQ